MFSSFVGLFVRPCHRNKQNLVGIRDSKKWRQWKIIASINKSTIFILPPAISNRSERLQQFCGKVVNIHDFLVVHKSSSYHAALTSCFNSPLLYSICVVDISFVALSSWCVCVCMSARISFSSAAGLMYKAIVCICNGLIGSLGDVHALSAAGFPFPLATGGIPSSSCGQHCAPYMRKLIKRNRRVLERAFCSPILLLCLLLSLYLSLCILSVI